MTVVQLAPVLLSTEHQLEGWPCPGLAPAASGSSRSNVAGRSGGNRTSVTNGSGARTSVADFALSQSCYTRGGHAATLQRTFGKRDYSLQFSRLDRVGISLFGKIVHPNLLLANAHSDYSLTHDIA